MHATEPDRRRPVVRRRPVGRRATRPSRSRTRPTSRSSPRSAATPLAEIERADRRGPPHLRRGRVGRPARRRAGRAGCTRFLDHVEARRRTTSSHTMMAEAGQPPRLRRGRAVRHGHGPRPATTIDLYLSMPHEEPNPVPSTSSCAGRVALSIRRHEPVGVVAAITPYNGAIIMAFQKLMPALMAGNSVILRPSPLTPISSLVFGAAADAAGIPPGVLSVVVEEGAAGAELLTTHPAVDMVSFTGSTAVGRQILAQAAPTVKRVSLELGGKSAQIYLDDAVDLAPLGRDGRRRHDRRARRASRPPGCWCPKSARTRCSRRSAPRTPTSRSASPTEPGIADGPADQRRRSASGASATSPWPRSTAARWPSAAAGRPASTGATTSSRPCSTCPTTPTRRPRTRSSARCIGVIGYDDVDDAVAHRQRQPLRALGPGLRRRRRRGHGGRPAAAHRRGQRQHLAVQRLRAGRRLQAERPRPRAGPEGIREFQEVKHMAIGELQVSDMTDDTPNLDWLISVDDHILEPPHLWVDRVAGQGPRPGAPHGDRRRHRVLGLRRQALPELGPQRRRRQDQGGVQPRAAPLLRDAARVLRPEGPPRGHGPAGILASLCFPTITRFCGQLFMEASDREFGLECLQDLQRLAGRGVVRRRARPLHPADADPACGIRTLAAEEMERMAARGVTAFAFSENPAPLGLPTIHDKDRYWDPVMAAGERARDGRVACTSARRRSCRRSRPTRRSWPTSPGVRRAPRGRCCRGSSAGMFQRYPNLKIALSEGEIGWMPVLPRAGRAGARQAALLGHEGPDVHGPRRHRRRPRRRSTSGQTFRDHIFGCFIEDHHGIASLDEIGEDNVMCETDYPHSDSTWPDCIDTARQPRSRTSRRRCSTSSCAATPSGSTGSRRPSRRSSPVRDRAELDHVDRDVCIGSGMCIVYAPGTFAQDAEAKVVVLDPPADDLDADPDRRRGLPDPSAAPSTTDERRLTHAARGQERHHHRRRLRRRPGLGPALRRGGRQGRRAPTSTSTAPRRRSGSSRRPAAPPSPFAVDVSEGGRGRGHDRRGRRAASAGSTSCSTTSASPRRASA